MWVLSLIRCSLIVPSGCVWILSLGSLFVWFDCILVVLVCLVIPICGGIFVGLLGYWRFDLFVDLLCVCSGWVGLVFLFGLLVGLGAFAGGW